MVEIKRIQKASPAILKKINSFVSQMSLSSTPPKLMTKDYFYSLVAQPNFHFLVALDAGTKKIIGMISVYFVKMPHGLNCFASDLFVETPYRKWGIGPLLVKKAIELARENRARHINMRTNPKRVEADRLYRALGFRRMETNFYRINLFK
ncbi:MAG: GNAT family N-acetyltransferase [bacterium]|nr:GNAT family N-acetyltransferase [bacterium]